MNDQIHHLLTLIYGPEKANNTMPKLVKLIDSYKNTLPAPKTVNHYFTQEDAVVITYGDMVQTEGERPLQTLRAFLEDQVGGVVNGVHLLPFYPYSSDDGFSVIDYLQVNPDLGQWTDIEAYQSHFRLMFDAVINHISQHSDWYQRFLKGELPYTEYFKTVDPDTDLSAVFRPRALPLLTPAETAGGTKYVWTTFSADQIDLNYESPQLLLEVLHVLLEYAKYGAELIRLDAIGFMWKVPGTRCLHLPQTHYIIQLMRTLLDEIAPQVALVTETNVPHHENISYFGDGTNEAQMVYNFSLPPLLMHAMHTGNASILAQWASTLEQPSSKTTFFNFCASHDGIGVTPARGILPDSEIEKMAQRVLDLGGFVSYKTNSDGSQSAYELNINYLNALGVPGAQESDLLKAKRFLASQAIMLALRGVPGIYFHSLFGSENWIEGVKQTGQNRTINRQKLDLAQLTAELANPESLRQLVLKGYLNLLKIRRANLAFHPNGEQLIHQLNDQLFIIERRWANEHILAVHNVTAEPVTVTVPLNLARESWINLLDGQPAASNQITLEGYGIAWLKQSG